MSASRIVTFLRSYVFKHEKYFACHKYNMYRSFGDYSNTPLEGTNGGLKYGYFAVKPNMSVPKSASLMFCQDERKYQEKVCTAYSNLIKIKLYDRDDNHLDARRIVPKAHGQFKDEYVRSTNYSSLRTDENKWIVRVTENGRRIDTRNKTIPIFLRFRVVRRTNNAFYCSCPFTTMYGIPCRHVIHVLSNYTTDSYRFSHQDFDVRWWTTYAFFVSLRDPADLDETESNIRFELMTLRSEQQQLKVGLASNIRRFAMEEYICGNENPRMLSEQSRNQLFPNGLASHPINYTCEEVRSAIASFSESYSGIQKTYMVSYDDNEDGDDDAAFGDSDDDDNAQAPDNASNERIAYAERNQHDRPGRINHYQEIVSLSKPLVSMLENCEDWFYYKIKQDAGKMFDDLAQQAHSHLIQIGQKRKATNQTSGKFVSALPVATKNCQKEHQKQRTHY